MIDLAPIRDCLVQIYGEDGAPAILREIELLIARHQPSLPDPSPWGLSEQDAMLITYPDQVRDTGKAPLRVLRDFASEYLDGLVNGIHILPFFPSSSDDGFSVVDYRSVDPEHGTWADIRELGRDFGLMFDAVVNHASVQSAWFRGFLNQEPQYRDFFITIADDPDLSRVVRPRTLPLLTTFPTAGGDRRIWTTFSADQVDLNYQNPAVILEILDLLLFYVEHGASFLRLDAIAYIWKEVGTDCIHRPEVHAIVQLMRAVLDVAAPNVVLLTETNVPHDQNVKYLGAGMNAANLVYNFALPPLVLHAFHTAQSRTLSDWASDLRLPAGGGSFFNVLATHDGIGLNGARGILSDEQIEDLCDRIERSGGRVSRKSNADGSTSPYEINANYFDALEILGRAEEADGSIARFLCAHAIMLAFRGMPGIYFHSMIGSRGWPEGVLHTGQARSVNRQKLDWADLKFHLEGAGSLRARIYSGLRNLLAARARSPAFAPSAPQRVLRAGDGILALVRSSPATNEVVLCLHNLTGEEQDFPSIAAEWSRTAMLSAEDLIGARSADWSRRRHIRLTPYESIWLRMAGTKGPR